MKFGMDRKPQPRKCPDCGKRLTDAKYGVEHLYTYLPITLRQRIAGYDKGSFWPFVPREYRRLESLLCDCWWIECKCGAILVWSYPQQWERRHLLELWDDSRSVA